MATCSSCGATVEHTQKFCTTCGAPLAGRGTRQPQTRRPQTRRPEIPGAIRTADAFELPSQAPWREPTSLLTLRWGGYRTRYVSALVLLIAGALVVQATSVYAGYLLVGGFAAHVAGWFIVPGRGGRRAAVAVPSALAASSLLLGSAGSVTLVVCLAAWLFVRQRGALSYLACLLPVAGGILLANLYPQYGEGLIVVGVSLAVVVASAWFAVLIDRTRPQR